MGAHSPELRNLRKLASTSKRYIKEGRYDKLSSPEAVFAFLDEHDVTDVFGQAIKRFATKRCTSSLIHQEVPTGTYTAQHSILGRIAINHDQKYALELDTELQAGLPPYAATYAPDGLQSFSINSRNGEVTNPILLPKVIGIAALEMVSTIKQLTAEQQATARPR